MLAREKRPGDEVVYCFIARSTYLASYGKELLLPSFIPVNGQDFSPQKERSEGPLVLAKSFPPLWARRISRGLLFRKTRASIKRLGDILSAMGVCKSSSIIYTLFTSDLLVFCWSLQPLLETLPLCCHPQRVLNQKAPSVLSHLPTELL